MSLLRFLGLGADTSGRIREPESLQEIAKQLESLPPAEARLISAFAYLLARIAGADLSTSAAERQEMAERLSQFTDVDASRADLLVESATRAAGSLSSSDNYLVARAFRDMTDRPDQLRLLRCLYAVASADENISGEEDDEIFKIASEIGLDHEDVIALRVEFREHLGVLKSLPGKR